MEKAKSSLVERLRELIDAQGDFVTDNITPSDRDAMDIYIALEEYLELMEGPN